MTLLQLKACLLIAMLAGHEAKRISAVSGSMAAMQAQTPAEEDFQELNKECGWSLTGGGCTGEGCAWRRLSKDWPPPSSQSCRHTDQFMLAQNGPANFKIMVGLLAAKSAKYKADCDGATIFNRGCARRQQQMTRAMKFIAKAESNAELMRGLTEEDKTANKESFQQSFDNLASTMGKHGALVLQLAEKMKADPATKKDPKVAVEKMVGVVHKLTLGSAAEQEAAEQTIQELEASPELDEAETRAAEENANKIAAQLSTEEDISEVLDVVDVVAPDDNSDNVLLGKNTSLLQVDEADYTTLSTAGKCRDENGMYPNYYFADGQTDESCRSQCTSDSTCIAYQIISGRCYCMAPSRTQAPATRTQADGSWIFYFWNFGSGNGGNDITTSVSYPGAACFKKNQVQAQGWGASIIAFVLIATLLVVVVVFAVLEVIAVIVGWAFLAILGCGAYAVGKDEGKVWADKIGFSGFAKCFVKVFAFPFVIIGTAAMSTYYFFRPNSTEVSNLQLSAPGAPSLVQTDVQEETVPGRRLSE